MKNLYTLGQVLKKSGLTCWDDSYFENYILQVSIIGHLSDCDIEPYAIMSDENMADEDKYLFTSDAANKVFEAFSPLYRDDLQARLRDLEVAMAEIENRRVDNLGDWDECIQD
jgi:hypothetical protein